MAALLVVAACGDTPGESPPPLSAPEPPAERSDESREPEVVDVPATASTATAPPAPVPQESPTDAPAAGVSGAVGESDAAMARAMRLARRVAEASPLSDGDEEAYVLFESRHVTSRTGDCVQMRLAPGEDLVLSAGGFAPGSLVEVEQFGATLEDVDLSLPSLGSVRVDGAGRLELVWTVPEAPPALLDPRPRGYVVTATGADGSGEVLVARPVWPLLVYPGAPPCAVDDAASTRLGEAVRIGVLDNDVAPSGGSLDPASLEWRPVDGGAHFGRVVADPADGSVTYTPDPGFVGVVRFGYEVRDNWGARVQAKVTVTVEAGCTITGTPGVVEIAGTSGDDVICVPDVLDRDARHTIYAAGGDDVILGGDGVDRIDGGRGDDTIYGRDGADRIDGGSGVDTIYGGGGFDLIDGGPGVDIIYGDDDDTIQGGDPPDVIHDDADGF